MPSAREILTPAQRQALRDKLARDAVYFARLLQRLDALGIDKGDVLRREAEGAARAVEVAASQLR